TEKTLVVSGLEDEQAALAMALAMASTAEVSGAAHLPIAVSGRFSEKGLGDQPRTVLRIEGFGPSVAYRTEFLSRLMQAHGAVDVLEEAPSRILWREIRDCRPFADGTQAPVWRVSVAPSEGHRLVDAFRRAAGA